jgi:hypothetical protein
MAFGKKNLTFMMWVEFSSLIMDSAVSVYVSSSEVVYDAHG